MFNLEVVRYYAVLAYSDNFNVLVIIIINLLRITVAFNKSLERNRLLYF